MVASDKTIITTVASIGQTNFKSTDPKAPSVTSSVDLTFDTYHRILKVEYPAGTEVCRVYGADHINTVKAIVDLVTAIGGHTVRYQEGPA